MPDESYQLGKYPPTNQVQMLVSRAEAIQAYAQLEFSLSMLFSVLLGAPLDVAGLVFFRITNTHSHNRILDDLMIKRHRADYEKFWNSTISLVRTIDQRRNEIVHWHVVNNVNVDTDTPHELGRGLINAQPSGHQPADKTG